MTRGMQALPKDLGVAPEWTPEAVAAFIAAVVRAAEAATKA